MKPKLFIFILGVIVGLLVAFFVPPVIQGWLPEGMSGGKSATQGPWWSPSGWRTTGCC